MMTHLQCLLAALLALQAVSVGCRESKQARPRSSSPGSTVPAVPRDAMVQQKTPTKIHSPNIVPPASPGLGVLTPLTRLGEQLRKAMTQLLRSKKPSAAALRPFRLVSWGVTDPLSSLLHSARKMRVRSLGDMIVSLNVFFRRTGKTTVRLDIDLLVKQHSVVLVFLEIHQEDAKSRGGDRFKAFRGPFSPLAKAASGLGILIRSSGCATLPIATPAELLRWQPSSRQATARAHLSTLHRALRGRCSQLSQTHPTETLLAVEAIRFLTLGANGKPTGILRSLVSPEDREPPGLEPLTVRRFPTKRLPRFIAAFMDKACDKHVIWWDQGAIAKDGIFGCTRHSGYTLHPQVYHSVTGSFLAIGAKEVLLAVVGGRAHADGFSYGAILRETSSGSYKQVAKLSFLADEFKIMGTFRASNGRDILVICASHTQHGITKGHCFDLDARTRRTDFAEPNPKPVLGFVFPWYDDRNGIPSGGTGLSYCMPKKSWKRDLNGDGKTDLVIRLEHGFIKHNISTGSRRTVRRSHRTVQLIFDGNRLKLKGRPPC